MWKKMANLRCFLVPIFYFAEFVCCTGFRLCGENMRSIYTVDENSSLTLNQDVCGHEKVVVKWKMRENGQYFVSDNVTLIDNKTKQYRFTYTIRRISRSYCGAMLTFSATHSRDTIRRHLELKVNFIPSKVQKVNFYYYKTNCIRGSWLKEDTGTCAPQYRFQMEHQKQIYITSSNSVRMCNVSKVKRVIIWTRYHRKAGQKTVVETLNKILDAETEKKSGYKDKIILGVVIGVVVLEIMIVASLIFIKRKGKTSATILDDNIQQRIGTNNTGYQTDEQSTRRNNLTLEEINPIYEQATPYYSELNVQRIKPAVYTELTKVKP